MSGDEVGNRISLFAVTGECWAVQVREQNPTSRPSIRAATSVDTKYSKLLGNKGGNRKLAFYRLIFFCGRQRLAENRPRRDYDMASLPSGTAVMATGWRHVFRVGECRGAGELAFGKASIEYPVRGYRRVSGAVGRSRRDGLCLRPFPGDHPERSGNMADSRRSGQHTARTRRSPRGHGWVCFRYLVYLNNAAFKERVVKTMDLCDQKTAP